jgi:predicted Zn-dependent protease with MMP-like domain/Tfp pilus assembly protein PilF
LQKRSGGTIIPRREAALARDYDELIDEAYEALEQERFDDALEFGRQAIDAEPDGAAGHYLAGAALVEMRRFEEGIPSLRTALDIDPDYPDARFCLAQAHFGTCHFAAARYELRRVLDGAADMADAHYWTGLCLERDGDYAAADAAFGRAAAADAERFPLPCRLPREDFDRAVEEAIALLPEYFRRYLDNVPIVVEDLPSLDVLYEFDPPMDPEILGLFTGTPLPERSLLDATPSLPSRIFLFRRNIERYSNGREKLIQEIRITLLHEVGHSMGLDDEGLERLGFE